MPSIRQQETKTTKMLQASKAARSAPSQGLPKDITSDYYQDLPVPQTLSDLMKEEQGRFLPPDLAPR